MDLVDGQTLIDVLKYINSNKKEIEKERVEKDRVEKEESVIGVRDNAVVIIHKSEFPKMQFLSKDRGIWSYMYNDSEFQFWEDVSPYFQRIHVSVDGVVKKFSSSTRRFVLD